MIEQNLLPLFWDTNPDTFVPTDHPTYTIERVLEHGNEDAVAWLRGTFSEEQIRDVLRTDRRLTPRSANFWGLVFGIPAHDIAALRGAQ